MTEEKEKNPPASYFIHMIINFFNPNGYSFEEIECFSKEFSVLLFVISGLFFILCYFVSLSYVFDAVLLTYFGIMARRAKSRLLAVFVFIYSLLTLYIAIQNRVHNIGENGANIVLASALLVACLVYLRSMLCYHVLIKSKIQIKNFFIKAAVSIVYFVILFFSFIFLFKNLPVLYMHLTISSILLLTLPVVSLYLGFAGIFPKGKNFVIVYQEDKPAEDTQ